MAIKRGSGSPTEDYYRQELGQVQRKLRLNSADSELLDKLASETGETFSALVARLVREEWKRVRKKK